MALRPVSPAGPDFPAGLSARQAPISRLARHGASPGWPGWPRFPKCPNRPRFPGWSGWLDCLVGLTARLLRNFTSRFDDGAPTFAGIVFTAAVVASASADDGAPLPTPHSPDRCRHLLILLTPPCWRSPTPLIAGQIAIIRTRAGSHFSGGATYGLHDYHPHAGRSQILTFHPFPIKPHEKIIGRGRFWVYLWDHM